MLLKSTSLNIARKDLDALSPLLPISSSLSLSLSPPYSAVYYSRTKKHVSPVGQIFVSIFPLPLTEFRRGTVSQVAREDSSGRLPRGTLTKKIDEYRDGTSSFCIAKESQRRARLEQRNDARVVSNVVAGDNEMAPFQRGTVVRFESFERASWKKEMRKREKGKKKLACGQSLARYVRETLYK